MNKICRPKFPVAPGPMLDRKSAWRIGPGYPGHRRRRIRGRSSRCIQYSKRQILLESSDSLHTRSEWHFRLFARFHPCRSPASEAGQDERKIEDARDLDSIQNNLVGGHWLPLDSVLPPWGDPTNEQKPAIAPHDGPDKKEPNDMRVVSIQWILVDDN